MKISSSMVGPSEFIGRTKKGRDCRRVQCHGRMLCWQGKCLPQCYIQSEKHLNFETAQQKLRRGKFKALSTWERQKQLVCAEHLLRYPEGRWRLLQQFFFPFTIGNFQKQQFCASVCCKVLLLILYCFSVLCSCLNEGIKDDETSLHGSLEV